MTWQVLVARARFPLLLVALVVLVFGDVVGIPWAARLGLFAALYVIAIRSGTIRRAPATVQPPVVGRWLALNSPGTRVPSHGIQAYGQSYAIDLVHEPAGENRPGFRLWPLARRATAFPGFGQPVVAATGGVVVRTHARERDHWSRTSWPALLYLLAEGVVREVTGPGRVLGNHVVVDNGGGTWAAYAHLRRGSVRVERGQRVEPGEHIADCGNSGNSTEPHLHFQLMDHPRVLVAAGLPMRFDPSALDTGPSDGLPANGEAIEVSGGSAATTDDRTTPAGEGMSR